MNFKHQGKTWEVTKAIEKPYGNAIDCRLPKASAEKLAKWLLATEPIKIELLGMRAYRDHAWRQHRVWGFRVTANGKSQIVEIAHQPDLSVRNRRRG